MQKASDQRREKVYQGRGFEACEMAMSVERDSTPVRALMLYTPSRHFYKYKSPARSRTKRPFHTSPVSLRMINNANETRTPPRPHSGFSSSNNLKLKGSNGIPSPVKCFDMASTYSTSLTLAYRPQQTKTERQATGETHPVQPQAVQHRRRPLHDTKNGQRSKEPKRKDYKHHEGAKEAGEAKRVAERHVPEHNGQLLVREGEGPEAEVGGGVGDAVEAEF